MAITCPSCAAFIAEKSRYCSRCAWPLTLGSNFLSKALNATGWLLRRSLGGFFCGAVGWILAQALSRAAGISISEDFHYLLGGAVSGLFLGIAAGVMERSLLKVMAGGALGLLAGAVGGLINPPLQRLWAEAARPEVGFLVGHAAHWALAGAFIGATSGLFERSLFRSLIGALFGAFGGALAGALATDVFQQLSYEAAASGTLFFIHSSWIQGRLTEAIAGGSIGAGLWFCVGIAEKFIIFRRTLMAQGGLKKCLTCNHENDISSRYCGLCGRALQSAAPREQLLPTAHRGLERLANGLIFLSWLFRVVGVVSACVVFGISLFVSLPYALFWALLTGLASYLLVTLSSALADALVILYSGKPHS